MDKDGHIAGRSYAAKLCMHNDIRSSVKVAGRKKVAPVAADEQQGILRGQQGCPAHWCESLQSHSAKAARKER